MEKMIQDGAVVVGFIVQVFQELVEGIDAADCGYRAAAWYDSSIGDLLCADKRISVSSFFGPRPEYRALHSAFLLFSESFSLRVPPSAFRVPS